MKTRFFSIVCLFLALSSSAATLTVDNNTDADINGLYYAAFADAHSAAVDGDTIYINPSSRTYGNITISKHLVIYGVGFAPQTNSKQATTLSSVTLGGGADNSVLNGLVITQVVNLSTSLDAVQITNCYIARSINFTNTSATLGQFLIAGCVLGSDALTSESVIRLQGGSIVGPVDIVSNLIFGSEAGQGAITVSGANILNNIFIGAESNTNFLAFHQVQGCNIEYNIFYGRSPQSSDPANFFGNSFSGNMTFQTSESFADVIPGIADPSNIDNDLNVDAVDPEFVNLPLVNDWESYFDPQTVDGSPAQDTSPNRGVYNGGSTEYFTPLGTALPVIETQGFSEGIVDDTVRLRITLKRGLD